MEILPIEEQKLRLRNALLDGDGKRAPLKMQPPVRSLQNLSGQAAHELEITAPWDTQILDPNGNVVLLRDHPDHHDKWTSYDGLHHIPPWMSSSSNAQIEEKT